jgi:hypothetical protein
VQRGILTPDEMMNAHITEPMTMVTDYLLAAESVVLAILLLVAARAAGGRSVHLWVLAFLVAAVAGFAGGTAHGFRLYLGEANWAIVWKVTVWSIGLGAVLMLVAGIRSALRPETIAPERRQAGVRWLKRGILVSAVGLVILVGKLSLHQHFNQNDMYHLVQMVGLYCFYRGACILHDLER